MKEHINISVIRDSVAFHNLQEEWNALLEHSASNTIFLRWEWLYNWWKVYRGNNRLFLIIARDNNSLIGIAPLYVEKAYFNKISFLGSNIVCSDYLNFILLKGREQEVLKTILSYLNQEKEEWDILELTGIPSKSDNLEGIISFFSQNRTIINEEYTTCPYIDLSSDWETIYGSFTSFLKSNISRKNKKFINLPYPSFEKIGQGREIGEYFDIFLNLNKLRLKDKDLETPFSDSMFQTFHRNILNEFHKKGMAELCFLKTNEDYLAGLYLFSYDHCYYYYQSGFNPEWQKLSPGTLLLYHLIKDAHENKWKKFDFLQGGEEYKINWTNSQENNAKIIIFNNTPRGYCKFFLAKARETIKKGTKFFQKFSHQNTNHA